MHQALFSNTHRSGLQFPILPAVPPLTLWMQLPSVFLTVPPVGIRQLWSLNLSSITHGLRYVAKRL